MLATEHAGPAALRGGVLRVVAFAVGSLVAILGISLLLRHLGPVETGRYTTALALTAIVAAISDLGLTAVGVRELSALPPGERWPLAQDLLGLRLTLTVLGAVAITAFAFVTYSATLAAGVALASLGLLLQVTQDNVSLPLVVDLRLGRVAILELLRPLLTTAFTVVLVAAGAGLLPFLAMTIPVSGLLLLLAYSFVRGMRRIRPRFDLARWRRFTRAMLPYSLAVAASALYFRISMLLVAALSNSVQAGYFGASFRIIEVLAIVPALLVSSAFPIFARAAHTDHERLGYAVGRVASVAHIAAAFTAVAFIVGAPVAISVIGGAKFHGAIPVLRIQGVALAAMFVSLVWANALLSLGMFRAILVVNVGMLVVAAALVAAFVEVDGARGAAIGTAIAEVAAAALQAGVVLHRRPALRPPLRPLPFIALAAGVGLLPLLLDVSSAVQLVLSIVLFAAIVLATRAYPQELLDLLPGRLRRDEPRVVPP